MDTVGQLLLKSSTKQKDEEELRRRREVQFPQSAAEYHTNQDKELQQRLARFLTSDAIIQEKMLTEYGWTWRQVQGLKEVYSMDVRLIRSISRRIQRTFFAGHFQRRHTEKSSCCQRPAKKTDPPVVSTIKMSCLVALR
jgi:hypothetical protein